MRNATAPKPPSFPSLVQQFFTEYLVTQRAVSPRTVACYRDAMMLFLDFAARKRGKTPTSLKLTDVQPDLILAFLNYLVPDRKPLFFKNHSGFRLVPAPQTSFFAPDRRDFAADMLN